jgi:dipeptidase D
MSSQVIDGLSPNLLWRRFYEISQVPRPSKNEERIRLYLINFAGHNNLAIKEDKTGNIVIQVPPKPGFEKVPTIVLQSHIDMVCEKNKETEHDFLNDPITLVRDGEWIKADGTTLGADNGIGAAAALAVVQDDSFNHGLIELLFTVDEETGLTGVNNLEKGFITGETLLNLDTEEDGAFYVGCAGGVDTVGSYKIENEEINKNFIPFSLFISGLKGGHSGINIADKRANAIKLIAFLLDKLKPFQYQLAYIQGGSKRNAIPREAEAVIFLNPDYDSKVRETINEFSLEAALEFRTTDNGIKITFEKKDSVDIKSAYKKEFTEKIINTLIAMPHGVVAMSSEIPELVETSTNLATINVVKNELIIGTCQRSSIESEKNNIARSIQALFELSKAAIELSDGYPGWQPKLDSKVLKLAARVFTTLFSKKPEIKAVHAGLECGILADKYPGIDMISFGPTIQGAHSPDERVKIHDVEKFYRLLVAILEEISVPK